MHLRMIIYRGGILPLMYDFALNESTKGAKKALRSQCIKKKKRQEFLAAFALC